MRRNQLVASTRGPGGGYTLAKKASEITVADIVMSVDEQLDASGCGGKENCTGPHNGPCMTHDLWHALNQRMFEFLRSISLQNLVDEQVAKGMRVEEKTMLRRSIATTSVLRPIRVNAPNSVFALGSINLGGK